MGEKVCVCGGGSSHEKDDVMNINCSHTCYFEQSLDINQDLVQVCRLSSTVVILTRTLSFIYILSSLLLSIILSIINSFVVLSSTLLLLFLGSSGMGQGWGGKDHAASSGLGWSRKTSGVTPATGRIYIRHAESSRTESCSCWMSNI